MKIDKNMIRKHDSLSLGSYPQEPKENERTPISWRVLDIDDDEAILISEYILDCKRYHNELVDTSWQKSDLRNWLNHHFYNNAFSIEEQKMIQSDYLGDYVSLLSCSELETYFADNRIERRTTATEYARMVKGDGCKLYVYDKSEEVNYMTVGGIRQAC